RAAADRLGGGRRPLCGGPVSPNADRAAADGHRHVEDGRADAVAFGRDYIATPDLAARIAAGLSPNSQNPATFYPDTDEELSVGYTDYPTRDTASLSG
ncbi:MAG: hypothetical protein L0K01_07765, partial [Brachybacterium sp.]|nr:hypothetical protein [Brachybacterium sp.]